VPLLSAQVAVAVPDFVDPAAVAFWLVEELSDCESAD
jgi:hypothetical protein